MAASAPLLFFLIIAAAAHAPPLSLSADTSPALPRLLNRTAHPAVLNRTGVRGSARFRFSLDRFVLNRSCSDEPVRWVGFEPALNEFLVRLRAGLLIGVDHGRFSYSENITIDGNTIYGIVGCIQTLTTFECKSCIDAATNELSQECGGKKQGYIANKSCFATLKFNPSPLAWPMLGHDGKEGQRDASRRVRLVLIGWTILAVCLVGLVLSVWFVQRSIMNRAKVCVLDGAFHDGKL